MKNIVLIITLFSISCEQVSQKSESTDSKKSDSFNHTLNFDKLTTALAVRPLKIISSSFLLDSVISEDTAFNYFFTLYFPRSLNHIEFNKTIKQFVEHQASLEKPDRKQNENTLFDLWINKLQISGTLIQCLFIEQSFTEGAAHYNHSYSTLNYDINKKKTILFTDLFKFSSKKEKQSFCDLVNEFNDGSSDLLIPKDLVDSLDYQISNESLTLYLDDFEKSPSMTSIGINIQVIQKYINPAFVYDYGLILQKPKH